ncbi:hypothetical protein IJL65_05175 [bacterium]|nr:hypothetical protein [bacterium]
MNAKTKNDYDKFLTQNTVIDETDNDQISDSDIADSLDEQNEIDNSVLNTRNDKTFQQCSSAGNIYSDEELNENLQELKG